MVNGRTPCVLCCEPIEANYLPGMAAELGVMLAPPIAALVYPFALSKKRVRFGISHSANDSMFVDTFLP